MIKILIESISNNDVKTKWFGYDVRVVGSIRKHETVYMNRAFEQEGGKYSLKEKFGDRPTEDFSNIPCQKSLVDRNTAERIMYQRINERVSKEYNSLVPVVKKTKRI